MADNTQERIDALEVALNNEKREKEFYLKQAERTKNPHGKKMFETIASDEDEHYNRILQLHDKLKNEGKWPESLPLEVKDTNIKNVLKNLVESVDTTSQIDNDDLEAVKTAIDFESRGEEFYKKLSENVDNPREKEFFELLTKMEREHRVSLENTLEYFKDPQGWFQRQEGARLDGA